MQLCSHGEKEQQENFVNNKSLPTSRYRTKMIHLGEGTK
jgi:hypothetical protein